MLGATIHKSGLKIRTRLGAIASRLNVNGYSFMEMRRAAGRPNCDAQIMRSHCILDSISVCAADMLQIGNKVIPHASEEVS